MILLLFLAVFSTTGVFAEDWENLRIKFDFLLDGYFTIPFTLEELTKEVEWKYMTTDEDLIVQFYSYGEDPRMAIGFDSYGNIAAVRVCYIIEDLTIKAEKNGLTFPFTFDDKPLFSKAMYWGSDVYYTTVLFASPEKLEAGGRADTYGLLAEEVYVKLNGEYTVMPRNESDATSLGFMKQSCFNGMGQHYFLNMTPTADCNDLPGVFLMYDKEELVGMGFSPFGAHTTLERIWYETPDVFYVKLIAPNSPSCLEEWTEDYGVFVTHLFFKRNPRLTYCW